LEEGDSIFMELDEKKEELTIEIKKAEKSPEAEK
jgi:ATP-dependent Clp protease ATP-binding subunit ClpC